MVAMHVHDGTRFDPVAFAAFLDAQPDLSPKWRPRFVRVANELPATATQKILKRVLQRERWECADPVFWRRGRETAYRELTEEDRTALREQFAQRGREHFLG
jgi:fatty-acyl-CoA synthase